MTDLIAFISLFVGSLLFGARQAGGALPPSTAQPAETPKIGREFTNYDLDTMARTMWGEARNEGYEGMQAVANVIMNRYELAKSNPAYARQFGRTPGDICKKPWQFSVWNSGDPNLPKILNVTTADSRFRTALEIAERALNGTLPDITGGADHYHATYVSPSWASAGVKTTQIKTHIFFKLS